ncbi:NAD(P)-dependent alcohol dehydrogenase [Paeniglutamicibacter psychrophenolicus]|uniref:NADPH:quinone reductase-like Zn-dependent oxidoreductase n=1 Tax=Paeniglutamicibacter psychrophenolicus TaxID=257454 RepID=A0ABS4WEE8_9MICC|nr:NAD(P)-dependent alcohol dehydrogenase [Paeniglutamicibacter psychrophenolicus]MBP2374571.1 NADPH:quinone reductase-like Zn-dependent oxidoreductase [Paeniglutamicibacter psychrophenolicus]
MNGEGQVPPQAPETTGRTAPQATMRAVTQDRYGDAEVLHQASIPAPVPRDNEVLVRVHAAGLDRGTWHLMTGTPLLARLAVGLRRPSNPVPGLDLAGTVAAVGAAATRFAVGDAVYGFGRGTFAEYAVAKEDRLAKKPANLDFRQAAVVPVSAATALQALRLGRVAAGQRVLVTGASGGVGSYAVQLAKALGAEVTGVASTAKQDLVLALGAEHAIDYKHQDFAEFAQHYDLIVDTGGNPSLRRLRMALAPTGTAVIVGGEGAGKWLGMNRQFRAVALSPFIRQRLVMLASAQRATDLEELATFLESGAVLPHIDVSFPLERAREAMEHLVAGKARGKIAITI